ncbi:MAG TPA: hypothetical protein VMW35_20300 [Myxococcota bacterium]|nr:hypothetical protein [Myxococcota bacterium]
MLRRLAAAVPLLGLGRWPRIALVLATLLAFASGSRVGLELLPALAWGLVAFAFVRSLVAPRSLAEELARLIDDLAPDFIGPFCRVLSGLYGLLAAAIATGIAVFALSGAHDAWRRLVVYDSWIAVAAFEVVSFVVRKLWFRHYTGSAIDRVFARCFPAENTERGRRSLAYVRRMREQIGGQRRFWADRLMS